MADKPTITKPLPNDHVTSPITVWVTIPNPTSYLFCNVTGAANPSGLPSNDANPPLIYKSVDQRFEGTLAVAFTGSANITAQCMYSESLGSEVSDPVTVTIDSRAAKNEPETKGKKKGGGGFGGQIMISSPQPGANVECTFTAAGTISNAASNNVSGSITDTSGNVYSGTTTVQGDGTWNVQFVGPGGSLLNCILKVWCTDDPTVFAQESLGGDSGGSGHVGGGGHLSN